MANGQKHVTLLAQARNDREWALVHALEPMVASDWLAFLKSLFLRTCGQFEEDLALRYLGYMIAQITNDEILPLCNGTDEIPHVKFVEKQAALERADAAVLALYLELWEKLPEIQQGIGHNRDQDGSTLDTFKTEVLALPKVRETIVRWVTVRWHMTPDKAEADALWSFLLKAARSRFAAQITMVQEAVRQYTPPASRQDRIMDALNAVTAEGYGSGLRHQLIMAWWRNTEPQVQNVLVRIDMHLRGVPFDALDLVERVAKETGELAWKAHVLVAAFNKVAPDDRWQYRAKVGGVQVFTGFPQPGHLALEVRIVHWTRQGTDDWFQEACIVIRAKVKDWHQANGTPPTLLMICERGPSDAHPPVRKHESVLE